MWNEESENVPSPGNDHSGLTQTRPRQIRIDKHKPSIWLNQHVPKREFFFLNNTVCLWLFPLISVYESLKTIFSLGKFFFLNTVLFICLFGADTVSLWEMITWLSAFSVCWVIKEYKPNNNILIVSFLEIFAYIYI